MANPTDVLSDPCVLTGSPEWTKGGVQAQADIQVDLLRSLGLSDDGVAYVLGVATEAPDRKVGEARRRNMVFDVAMQRHRITLQAESMKGEHLFLLDLDHQRDVLAIYDQPRSIPFTIVDRRGHSRPVSYTADYLVVLQSAVIAYEIKEDGDLQTLIADRPSDWIFENGQYIYKPAVAAFARFGIRHKTIPNSTLNSVRGDNLRLLASARSVPSSHILSRLETKIRRIVEYEGVVRIDEIMDRLEIIDQTPVLRLIDSGAIFADIDHCLLSDTGGVWVAATMEDASLARTLDGTVAELLAHCGQEGIEGLPRPSTVAEIARRISCLRGEPLEVKRTKGRLSHDAHPSGRTLRRWRSKERLSNGDPRSLEPRWYRCGNRELRRSNLHEAFIAGNCQKVISIRLACRYAVSVKRLTPSFV